MNITGSFGGVMGGVSQQPDILRQPGQCHEQTNMWLDVVNGVRRRAGMQDIATLDTDFLTDEDAYFHFFTLDTITYVAVLTATGINVYDLQGNSYPTHADDYSYITGSASKSHDISAVQLGEYNMFATRKTLPAMSTFILDQDEFMVFHIFSGMEWGLTYTITYEGTSIATYTTPDGSTVDAATIAKIESTYVADQLATDLDTAISPSDWTVVRDGNCIVCHRAAADVSASHVAIRFAAEDGRGGTTMDCTVGEVQSLDQLPPRAYEGHWVRVRGTSATSVDDFYMQYNKIDGDADAEGVWTETSNKTEVARLDPGTMPHALIKADNGEFYFKALDGSTVGGSIVDKWKERNAGDTESNPEPAFIGQRIRGLGMVQNRMMIITDDHVNLSKTREEFNYWADSALDVVDTDPVDLTTPGTEVAGLFFAVEHDQFMAVLGVKRQFAISLKTVLTPYTAALIPTTTYEIADDCIPTAIGSSIYFAYKQFGYTGVREYKAAVTIDNAMVADKITAHIDKYIPATAHQIISDTQNGVLMVLTRTDELFIYQKVTVSEEVIMSGWHKIAMPKVVPRAIRAEQGKFYILGACANGLRVYMFDPLDNIFLDYMFTGEVIGGEVDTSLWNFRECVTIDEISAIVVTGAYAGMQAQIESITSTSISLKEESIFEGETVRVGLKNESVYSPTMPVLRDSKGKVKLLDKLIIGSVDVTVMDTGKFSVDMDTKYYDTTTQEFTSRAVDSSFIVGETSVTSRIDRVSVWNNARETILRFKCDTPHNMLIQSLEYKGNYTQRGGRY